MNARDSQQLLRVERLSAKIHQVLRLHTSFPALARTVNRLRTTLATTANLLLPCILQLGVALPTPVVNELDGLVQEVDACLNVLSCQPLQAFLFGMAYMHRLREHDEQLLNKLRQILPQRALVVLETLQQAQTAVDDVSMDHYEEPASGVARSVDALSPRWQAIGVVESLSHCREQLHSIQENSGEIGLLPLSQRERTRLEWIRKLKLDCVGAEVNESQRDAVLEQIFAADTVYDFLRIYESSGFNAVNERLRGYQKRARAKDWAKDFVEQYSFSNTDESEIIALHADFRLLRCYLWELYQRCHSPRSSQVTVALIRSKLKTRTIVNILPHVLALDRAYMLYVERKHWVSAKDVEGSVMWRERLVADGQGVTIDRRYVWLVWLTEHNMAGLLAPVICPRIEEAAAVVVDAVEISET